VVVFTYFFTWVEMIDEFLLAPGARLLPTRDSKAITRRQVEKKILNIKLLHLLL
jgi:hypothetical protein